MLFLFLLLLQSVGAESPVFLNPGASEILRAPSGQTVRVEKRELLHVTDLKNSLRLKAKKIGMTQLHVGSQTYQVWILNSRTYLTAQKIKTWLKNKRGPELKIENHQLIIRGRFLTFEDWLELSTLMTSEDDFSIQAQMDNEIRKKVEQNIKSHLEDNHLSFSHFSLKPSWSLTVGKLQDAELNNYKRVLKPYGIDVRFSAQSIPTVPLIEVSVIAVEIQRSEMSRLGIQWPAGTPFQILPDWNTPRSSLVATIDHLEENGKARVLAKPTLLSQSGEEATFHSGGEFPIKAINQFQANVVWKKYGLLLKIKPRADHQNKMDLKIDCEFSALDSREDDSGVPGLIVHRVTSHFNLTQSKTIALSGLIKEEWRRNQRGLPGLLNIPILHQLFSSESYQNNQSELVFFVTPKVIHE